MSSPSPARFRLLSLHPGPGLAELTRAHLVAEHVPGRYAPHELLRAYAADQARNTDSQPEQAAAVARAGRRKAQPR